VSEKTGVVVGVRQVSPDDEIMLISQQGKLIRTGADGVSIIGRATQGVRVMDLDEGDILVAIAKIREDQQGDDEDPDGTELDESGEAEADGDADAGEPVN